MANVEQKRAEAERMSKLAGTLVDLAEQKKQERKHMLQESLYITIGFTKSLKKCFIAYYDYATHSRVVLDAYTGVDIEFWSHWKKKYHIVHQFVCSLNLAPCVPIIVECLKADRPYPEAICVALSSVGLFDGIDPRTLTVSGLYDYICTSSFFTVADPADFIEDITDED